MDFVAHMQRAIAFSRATFGPDERTHGVSEHIRKELDEIAACANASERAHEWVDVLILALDGFWRALDAIGDETGDDETARSQMLIYPPLYADIPFVMAAMLVSKQAKNEQRAWPDWRTASPDHAIEHVRGVHD